MVRMSQWTISNQGMEDKIFIYMLLLEYCKTNTLYVVLEHVKSDHMEYHIIDDTNHFLRDKEEHPSPRSFSFLLQK
jgi:alpha/beta superfamily hydrolase